MESTAQFHKELLELLNKHDYFDACLYTLSGDDTVTGGEELTITFDGHKPSYSNVHKSNQP